MVKKSLILPVDEYSSESTLSYYVEKADATYGLDVLFIEIPQDYNLFVSIVLSKYYKLES